MTLVLLVQGSHSPTPSGKRVGIFIYHCTGVSEGTVEMFMKEDICRGTSPWRVEQNRDECRGDWKDGDRVN